MAAVVGFAGSASADLLYTFDFGSSGTDGGGFVGGTYGWDPSVHAVRQTTTVGGWTIGNGPKFEFAWPCQSIMQGIANNGNGKLAFDLFVDDVTFSYWGNPSSTWYQLHYAANSDNGWQQDVGGYVQSDYNPSAPPGGNNQTWHFEVTFAQLGWVPGTTWFQLFYGSNSDIANAVQFCIDNIHVSEVPEPGTLALAGLGVAGLWMFRRRSR